MSNSKEIRKDTSKVEYLNFPASDFCTTSLFFGPPGSGKTFLALQCIRYWIENGFFETYVMIIPQYKREMNGSYKWLDQYMDRVHVFESFNDEKIQKFVDQQKKWRDEVDAEKRSTEDMPRMCFFIDDGTSLSKDMFKSSVMRTIVTENRHIFIHSLICCHYLRSVVDKAVRANIKFYFVYPVKTELLQDIHKEYIPRKFKELDNFKKDFLPFFEKYVEKHKYPCLLIGPNSYNPNCCNWFKDEKNK
jgi:hypothetical protein